MFAGGLLFTVVWGCGFAVVRLCFSWLLFVEFGVIAVGCA